MLLQAQLHARPASGHTTMLQAFPARAATAWSASAPHPPTGIPVPSRREVRHSTVAPAVPYDLSPPRSLLSLIWMRACTHRRMHRAHMRCICTLHQAHLRVQGAPGLSGPLRMQALVGKARGVALQARLVAAGERAMGHCTRQAEARVMAAGHVGGAKEAGCVVPAVVGLHTASRPAQAWQRRALEVREALAACDAPNLPCVLLPAVHVVVGQQRRRAAPLAALAHPVEVRAFRVLPHAPRPAPQEAGPRPGHLHLH